MHLLRHEFDEDSQNTNLRQCRELRLEDVLPRGESDRMADARGSHRMEINAVGLSPSCERLCEQVRNVKVPRRTPGLARMRMKGKVNQPSHTLGHPPILMLPTVEMPSITWSQWLVAEVVEGLQQRRRWCMKKSPLVRLLEIPS